MKLIYICSPYRATDAETLHRNIEYAKALTRTILLRGDCPVTPHLYIPWYTAGAPIKRNLTGT